MRDVIEGNISNLQKQIEQYGITACEIIEMRGLDFIVPVDIEDPKKS